MDFELQVDGRYVCWHSHQARWVLGPERLAERFAADFHRLSADRGGEMTRAYRVVRDVFPTATRVWRRS